jgi:hypothetical protein
MAAISLTHEIAGTRSEKLRVTPNRRLPEGLCPQSSDFALCSIKLCSHGCNLDHKGG